jgi:hypothetical protein
MLCKNFKNYCWLSRLSQIDLIIGLGIFLSPIILKMKEFKKLINDLFKT